MRMALVFCWLLGAAAIGVALLWACYQLAASILGQLVAIATLTVLLVVVGVTWVVAVSEYPIDVPERQGAKDSTWRY